MVNKKRPPCKKIIIILLSDEIVSVSSKLTNFAFYVQNLNFSLPPCGLILSQFSPTKLFNC